MQLLEKQEKITDIELEQILEISLVDNPAVPEAKFLVVKRAEGLDIEEEEKEEEEVSKNMDIEKLLKSFKRKLKALKKESSLEKVMAKIDKLIEAIDTILEEGGEYGYPAPEEVSKRLDSIELEPASGEDNNMQKEFEAMKADIEELKKINQSLREDLNIIAEALTKVISKGGN